jgi:hypothetical protein
LSKLDGFGKAVHEWDETIVDEWLS